MDMEAISDYLTLQYVPAPKTGFQKIYKLPSASYFIFKDEKLKINKYWSLDFSKNLILVKMTGLNCLKQKVEQLSKQE